jgi:hypothetical protein
LLTVVILIKYAGVICKKPILIVYIERFKTLRNRSIFLLNFELRILFVIKDIWINVLFDVVKTNKWLKTNVSSF